MKKIALILILFTLSVQFTNAQFKSNKLTLSECLEIAHKESPAVLIARENYKSSKLNYQAFNASFYPQVNFSGAIPGLVREINTVTQPDGTELFIPQSRLFSTGNIQISQKIPLTGADVSISSGLNRIDLLGDNGSSLWMTTPLQISLSQPIFQFDPMEWDREIQDLQADENETQYLSALEGININITNKFFNLYIAKMNVKNAELNLAINDTLYRMSQGRFKVGTIAENDLLKSELELTNAQIALDDSKLIYLEALDNLELTLGVTLPDDIRVQPPLSFNFMEYPENIAIQKALNNSTEIINNNIRIKQSEREIDRVESQNSFNARLTASYGLNKTTTEPTDLYSQLLDQERFNLTFSVPLFQWNKGDYDIESAISAKFRNETQFDLNKKEIELQIKYEILKFNQLQRQVISAARNDTIASRRFEVAKNRYIIGKIDMNDLFLAQREKDSASKQYFNTLSRYWAAYYNIRKMTLFDFLNRKDITLQSKRF